MLSYHRVIAFVNTFSAPAGHHFLSFANGLDRLGACADPIAVKDQNTMRDKDTVYSRQPSLSIKKVRQVELAVYGNVTGQRYK